MQDRFSSSLKRGRPEELNIHDMYGAVCEFQRPAGVTHALRGRFGAPGASTWGVIFVKRSVVELYNVRANEAQARLELINTTSLPTQVISAGALRRPGSADFLWLGFTAMRVAALAWNEAVRDWHTLQTVDVGEVMNRLAATRKFTSRDRTHMSSAPGDEHRVLIRGRYSDQSSAVLRMDRKGRCVAVLANKLESLVILPVRGDDDLAAAAADPANVTEKEPLVRESDMFVIDLKEEYGVSNVKDFVFLDDYFEPTVLLLHEPKRTWAGRISVQSKTAKLVAVSLDLRKKTHGKTWAMEKLPSDAHQVIGIPESAGGGVLVISPNVLLQVRHEACVAGLSFNCFGDAYAKEMSSSYSAIVRSKTLMALDASRCCFLDYQDPGLALVSLKGGELYFLSIAGRGRSSMSMTRAGSTVLASAIVPLNERLFILASRISDSLLIEYKPSGESVEEKRDMPDVVMESEKDGLVSNGQSSGQSKGTVGSDINDAPAKENGAIAHQKKTSKKRRRTAEEEAEYEMLYGTKPPVESDSDSDAGEGTDPKPLELAENDEGTRGVYDDDDELGQVFSSGGRDAQGTVGEGDGNTKSWALMVKDTLTSFGPAADLAVGRAADDVGGALDIIVAGGYAKNGCLGVVQHSLRPRDITRFALDGFTRCWTLRDPHALRRANDAQHGRNNAILARNTQIRARNAKREAARQRYIVQRLRETVTSVPGAEGKKDTEQDPELDCVSEASKGDKERTDKTLNGIADARDAEDEQDLKRLKVSTDASAEDGNETTYLVTNDVKSIHGDRSFAKSAEAYDDANLQASSNRAHAEAEAEQMYPFEVEESPEVEEALDVSLHSYLLLSNETSTVAMSTGEDLEQLNGESIGFVTSAATIAAANVLDREGILQVHSKGAVVILEGRVVDSYTIDDGAPEVTAASIIDPYVSLLLSNGSVLILKVMAEFVDEFHATSQENRRRDTDADGEFTYDEYGMEAQPVGNDPERRCTPDSISDRLPSTNVKSDSSERNSSAVNHDHVSGVKQKVRSAFLKQDFTLDVSRTGDPITSAHVYSGYFGADIKRELSGSTFAQDPLTAQGVSTSRGTSTTLASTPGGLIPPSSENESSSLKPSVSTSEDPYDDMDEEERMLYGDAASEEDGLRTGGFGFEKSAESHPGDMLQDGRRQTTDTAVSASMGDVSENVAKSGGIGESETGVLKLDSAENVSARRRSYLLVLATRDGALEIRSMLEPEYPTIFRCAHFFLGPLVVVDDGCIPSSTKQEDHKNDASRQNIDSGAKSLKAKKKDRISCVLMTEIAGSVLVPGLRTPLLVAIQASGFPLIYSLYVTQTKSGAEGMEQSKLRMRRVISNSIANGILTSSASKSKNPVMVPFENVAGRGGIFIGGTFPFFIFAERGFPRMHAFRYQAPNKDENEKESDLGLTSFCELHNVNCPRGFVYVVDGGIVGISEMSSPATLNVDSSTPFRKISLRCTPHKVAYHAGSDTYGVLASMPTLTTREERLTRMLQSLEKHDKRHYQSTVAQAEAEAGDESAERVPPLYEELHELRIYRPDSWQLIKSFKLKKGEVGLAICNMFVDVYKQRAANSGVHIPSTNKAEDGGESLFAASQKLRPKNMLIVGTGYLNGEDATSRGRLLMFEISRQEVYSEASGEYTAFQLQLIAEKELPGPVSAVAPLEGYVVAGVGPQLGVYKLVVDEIVYLSFAFGQLFCTSLASVKQYVVSADMYKSISFYFFRDRNTSVNFLAKDYSHALSYACEFLIDGSQLSMVMSDEEGNVELFNYAHAKVPESRGGKRLLLNGAINYGSRINRFQRVKFEEAGSVNNAGARHAGRHATLFCTSDGGFGAIVPVNEVQHSQLQRLSKVMVDARDVVRHAGIDPVDARAFRPPTSSTQTLANNLIDTRLALEVLQLGPARVRLVASAADMTLAELMQLTSYLEKVLGRF